MKLLLTWPLVSFPLSFIFLFQVLGTRFPFPVLIFIVTFCKLKAINLGYNTNFIVNSPWGLFRDR